MNFEYFLLFVIEKTSISLNMLFLSSTGKNSLNFWNSIFKNIFSKKSKMLEAKIDAEDKAKKQADFLANMSHEIRTPLNGIIGTIHLLNSTKLDSEQKEYLDTMITSSEHLLGVINEILDYSKIDAEKMELEFIPFDLGKALNEVVKIQRLLAQKKGLVLEVENCQLDHFWYVGDPTRIKQILVNIINNALKFTSEGGVYLSLTCRNTEGKDGLAKSELLFQIRDTGIGIPKDRQSSVFSGFQQVDSSITRKYGGTGLGLSISNHLCREMGGEIWVESEEGVGTSFFFTVKLTHEEAQVSTTTNSEDIDSYNSLSKAHPLRILITEDNTVNQGLLLKLLEKMGYIADLAVNGAVACEKVKEKDYDLILMDIQMPVMDGLTATKNIRKMKGIFQPRVVALTASILYGDREKLLESGMEDFMTKPIKVSALTKALKDTPVSSVEDEIGNIEDDFTDEIFDEFSCKHFREKNVVESIDVEQVLNNLGGDHEILQIAIDAFLESTPGVFAKLSQAIKDGLAEEIRQEAHTLKGIFSNFGNLLVVELAFQLEMLGKEEKVQESREIFLEFEKEYHIQFDEVKKLKDIPIAA